jgi:hypothetical protein
MSDNKPEYVPNKITETFGLIEKWGGKGITVAEKEFKGIPYLDIETNLKGRRLSGVSLSYKNDFEEIKQLAVILNKFLKNHAQDNVEESQEEISSDDPF